jgi:diacylglycerol kinase (ATP)
MLPLGTGNDLAELIGMPRKPETALAALRVAEPVAVDVGRVRWREEEGGAWQDGLFLNAMGVGFDALVAAEAARFKRFRGKSAYLAGILRALVLWPQPTVTVERLGPSRRLLPDGTTGPLEEGTLLHRGPLFLAAAGNGRSVGGGFRLTPHASLVDGLLDLCFVEDVRKRRLPVLIPQVIRGAHLGAPEVVSERLPGLRLLAPDLGVPMHLDGEVLTTRAVEIEAWLEPGALRLLCPDPRCAPLEGRRSPSSALPWRRPPARRASLQAWTLPPCLRRREEGVPLSGRRDGP